MKATNRGAQQPRGHRRRSRGGTLCGSLRDQVRPGHSVRGIAGHLHDRRRQQRPERGHRGQRHGSPRHGVAPSRSTGSWRTTSATGATSRQEPTRSATERPPTSPPRPASPRRNAGSTTAVTGTYTSTLRYRRPLSPDFRGGGSTARALFLDGQDCPERVLRTHRLPPGANVVDAHGRSLPRKRSSCGLRGARELTKNAAQWHSIGCCQGLRHMLENYRS